MGCMLVAGGLGVSSGTTEGMALCGATTMIPSREPTDGR